MTSVGEDLRRERLREARASSAAERVSAALSLGDLDVEIYACARGIDPATARRRLAGRRRVGRQRSGCVEALRR